MPISRWSSPCEEHADKIDEIAKECPSLTCRVMIDGKRPGWISYPLELNYPAPVSAKIVNFPGTKKTKSTDPLRHLFHLRYNRRAEDGGARPQLPAGAHRYRPVLA